MACGEQVLADLLGAGAQEGPGEGQVPGLGFPDHAVAAGDVEEFAELAATVGWKGLQAAGFGGFALLNEPLVPGGGAALGGWRRDAGVGGPVPVRAVDG